MKVITLRQLIHYLNNTMNRQHGFTYCNGNVEIYSDLGIVGCFSMNIVRDALGTEPYIPLRGVELMLYGYVVNASTLEGYTYILD